MTGTVLQPTPVLRTPQPLRRSRMHNRIIDAVIDCLDRLGYVETSISRVVEQAGVSRGALQHHFPTREDLMAGVADQLMRASMEHVAIVATREPRVVADELAALWTRLVDTRPYRALLELLHAMRTDRGLRKRLEPLISTWNSRFEAEALRLYCAVSGSDEEVRELLVLCRSAMRGLVIQEQINPHTACSEALVRRLITLIAPLLQAREVAPAPVHVPTAHKPAKTGRS